MAKPALVALRRERERVVELLCDRFADDTIDVDEFEHRVDLAHQANDVEALLVLVEDLQPIGEQVATVPDEEPSPAADTALAVSRPEKKSVIAIIGGAVRKGSWRVAKKLRVYAVMGGVELDFRDVTLPPGVTEVRVIALMGGVEIIVPPNLAVECDGTGIMGGFEFVDRSPDSPDPDRPLLRISGFVIMGGLELKTRKAGESARQARRRRKKEKKQLAKQEAKQLKSKN